jgi:hypothetical protein
MKLITGVFTWELTSEELVTLTIALKHYAYTQQVADANQSAKCDMLATTINRVLHPQ